MIPLVIAAGVVGGIASTVAASSRGGVGPVAATQNLLDRAHAAATGSDEPLIARWERRHGTRPARIVSAQGTAYPVATPGFLQRYFELPEGRPLPVPAYPPANHGQLAGIVEVLGPIAGGELPAEVLACLCSVEGGRGKPDDVGGRNGGNLRRFNPGNFKFNRERDAGRPCWHLIDGAGSFDFYPGFDNWNAGVTYWIQQVFAMARYRDALPAARRGDLRGFVRALGAGGYADAYRNENALTARYIDRVNARSLSGVLVKRGLLSGYAWRNNQAVRT